MTAERPISDDDLHSLADGRLPLEQQADVDAVVAASADAAARVNFYRRLNAELHAAFDFMLSEPVPARLTARPRRSGWRSLAPVAAALALLAAGAGGGWLARDRSSDADRPALALAELAAYAHTVYAVEVRHPVEVPAVERDHLQAWLSKRLDRPIRVPDLTVVGYEFIGGRLLPSDLAVAGQFMYQNEAGHRVTLYIKPVVDQRGTALRFVEAEGVSVWYWHDEKLAYALASELPREQLKAICNEVYGKLNPDAAAVDW